MGQRTLMIEGYSPKGGPVVKIGCDTEKTASSEQKPKDSGTQAKLPKGFGSAIKTPRKAS